MTEWFESMAGPGFAQALMWTALALLGLFLVLIAVKVFRRLSSGTFIAGGRNRKARLAVLDATAVDAQRRLVLVRRDDVEHLILIGGANDLVVERDIRTFEESHDDIETDAATGHHQLRAAPERPVAKSRPASPSAPHSQATVVRPAAPSRPSPNELTPSVAAPQPVAAPPVGAAPRPTPSPIPVERDPRVEQPSESQARQAPRPAQEPLIAAASPTSASPATAGATALDGPGETSKPRRDADLDDALLEELELTLEEEDRRSAAAKSETKRREPHLDDEMDRLLGELSSERR